MQILLNQNLLLIPLTLMQPRRQPPTTVSRQRLIVPDVHYQFIVQLYDTNKFDCHEKLWWLHAKLTLYGDLSKGIQYRPKR